MRQNILDLDVTVDDVELMQARDSSGHLHDDLASVLFGQWLNLLAHQIVKKVSAWHEFSHDEQMMCVLEVLDKWQNATELALRADAQHLELLEHLVVLREKTGDLGLVHHLDGDLDL